MNLEDFLAIDHALGSPSQSFRAIHVTGTNGKGTVALKIAEGLTKLGYKTGMFTSPHIYCCTERIQIDDKKISGEELTEHLTHILELSRELNFFEILTLAAFRHFREEKVDFGVIEVGIGGKKDPTNIITPKLSIITSISYDHVPFLGTTLEEIGEQKAGIIKPGIPALLGHSAIRKEVCKRAFELFSPLHFMPPIEDWEKENEAIAKKALEILLPGVPLPPLVGKMPCRYEKEELEGVPFIFDIAHNQEALRRLFIKVERDYPSRPLYVVFNMSRDKDSLFFFSCLEKKAKGVFFYRDTHPRLLTEEELPYSILEKNHTALESLVEEAKENGGVVLVTGSAYIMKGVKYRFR